MRDEPKIKRPPRLIALSNPHAIWSSLERLRDRGEVPDDALLVMHPDDCISLVTDYQIKHGSKPESVDLAIEDRREDKGVDRSRGTVRGVKLKELGIKVAASPNTRRGTVGLVLQPEPRH